ncbi:acyl-CoA N-acyltransferase [Fomitopsis serialis]|uniref:acyl-CoA N-acyltransferase n=1 Tax=Fomitopsis serialis TaxID=139415 RepID=UPI002008BC42|nr:acyl-CoA N-acyltransferase [Neoantrodia serialis]KAH9925810.1 acyl-CoA N-acyltransferase [Neoantrodia serialis]
MPFTTDSELDLLFPAEHIPDEARKQLHPDLHLRPLASTDYRRGHLSVLSVLTVVTDPGEDAWATDRIVAVGTVFIERNVGHIEDIAVDKSQQGKKLGLRIIQTLTGISENSGCYKTILNCSDSNIPFYQKCGYEKKENEMAKYAPERSRTPRL